MSSFQDHFSGHARAYADARPVYPDSLFAAIAACAPAQNMVWDVGCGNGQASCGLAEHFRHVIASDASDTQIANAKPHPQVNYRVAPAEMSGLVAASIDAIVVCQALHWFNFDQFYAEVRRVARPGAVIIAVAYALTHISPAIDAAVNQFYTGDIAPYWPADRAHIETGYRDIPWPFEPFAFPSIAMTAEWSLDHLIAYLSTWSAVARYRQATGDDPIPAIRAQLMPIWGEPAGIRTAHWPLIIKTGRL